MTHFRSVHCVTPLWCAAVVGNLPIIQLLLKRGADINAVSDSGSTPVRSACFMTHIEIGNNINNEHIVRNLLLTIILMQVMP